QDPQHHEGDGLGEVQRLGRLVQDPVGVAYIGVHVAGDALWTAGEQGPRMDQHQGVVVHVDDAALRGDRLGDLVGVVGGGQAGADVEELPDARLAGQIPDGPDEKGAGGTGDLDDIREYLTHLIAELPVDGEV